MVMYYVWCVLPVRLYIGFGLWNLPSLNSKFQNGSQNMTPLHGETQNKNCGDWNEKQSNKNNLWGGIWLRQCVGMCFSASPLHRKRRIWVFCVHPALLKETAHHFFPSLISPLKPCFGFFISLTLMFSPSDIVSENWKNAIKDKDGDRCRVIKKKKILILLLIKSYIKLNIKSNIKLGKWWNNSFNHFFSWVWDIHINGP